MRKSGIKCCSTSKILENLIFHDYLHYLMKINHLSLRNDDAPVGFSYGLYRQEINGHFIYCDTKGFTWHSICFIFYKQITNIAREIFSEVVNLHQACESCDKKTFAFVGMGIGKKLVCAGGGMGKDH